MRFYYISIVSILLLALIWLIGTGLLAWFGSWLRKRIKHAWVVMVPLFLLLYIGPISEELLIAWNFGQLCKKDAGISINKTVEVEGFYDATRPARPLEPTDAAKASMDASGYRFHERPFPDTKGGPSKVVRFDKIDGDWKVSVIDKPTARYHFETDSGVQITHGVRSQTATVIDTETGGLIGRYTRYNRAAPWFFVGLDRPRFACDGPDGGPDTSHSFLIYRDVLKPIGKLKGE